MYILTYWLDCLLKKNNVCVLIMWCTWCLTKGSRTAIFNVYFTRTFTKGRYCKQIYFSAGVAYCNKIKQLTKENCSNCKINCTLGLTAVSFAIALPSTGLPTTEQHISLKPTHTCCTAGKWKEIPVVLLCCKRFGFGLGYSHHLYPVKKHLSNDGNGLFQMLWSIRKWCKSNATVFTVTRFQLKYEGI